MKFSSILLLILLVFLAKATLASDRNLQAERMMSIQKFAVCHCLAQSYKGTGVAADALNAAGGYFETGTAGAGLYFSVQDFSEQWARNKKYNSKHGSDLAIMKCLDLYNSPELISLIRKLQ